ncbi:hypothetical protein TorRG33x02_230920 [Trema orientale]|uniref:Uncharacterized protein n=1 Tax=Trema orientale TaxID=63057 RepID=A0A2P5E6H3_TREOI|nr:hypothetical protein TorRG33x02_230920 [Trema orientale]
MVAADVVAVGSAGIVGTENGENDLTETRWRFVEKAQHWGRWKTISAVKLDVLQQWQPFLGILVLSYNGKEGFEKAYSASSMAIVDVIGSAMKVGTENGENDLTDTRWGFVEKLNIRDAKRQF